MIKALILAPILLQIILTALFLWMNHEYHIMSVGIVIGANLLIYMVYCIIVLPIAYAISLYLAQKYWLNFFSIVFGSLLMWLIVAIIGYLIFNGALPKPIWKLFTDWLFYGVAVFVGSCYWGILYSLNNREIHEKN